MNTAFIDYVDRLFEQAAPGKRMDALKEEVIVNLNEKYNDYRAEGLSQESAYEAAISGLGDIKSLIRELGSTKKSGGIDAPFAASLRWATQLVLIAGAVLCLLLTFGNLITLAVNLCIAFSGIATVNIIRSFSPYDGERRDLLGAGVGMFFVAAEFFVAFPFAWNFGVLRFLAMLIAFLAVAAGVGLIIYGFAALERKKRMTLAISVPTYIIAAGLMTSIIFLDSGALRIGVLVLGFAGLALFFFYANRKTNKSSYKYNKKEIKMTTHTDGTIDYRGNGQPEGAEPTARIPAKPEVMDKRPADEKGMDGVNPHFMSAFWCFVVLLYMGISFASGAWAYTWIIFVAAAGLLNLYMGIMRNRK